MPVSMIIDCAAMLGAVVALLIAAELNSRWLLRQGLSEEEIYDLYANSMDEFLYGD